MMCSFVQILLCGVIFQGVKSGNVLIVPPLVSPSHKLALVALGDELAERGHNVLVYEPTAKLNKYIPKKAKIDHFVVHSEYEILEGISKQNDSMSGFFIWGPAFNKPVEESLFAALTSLHAKHYLADVNNRQNFLKLLETKWDLVIVDELFNNFGYMLAELLRQKYDTALAVYVSNMRMTLTAANFDSIPLPLAYWPSFGNVNGYSDKMNVYQRAHSLCLVFVRHLAEALKEIVIRFNLQPYVAEFQGSHHALFKPDVIFSAFAQEFELTFPTKTNVAYIGGIHVKRIEPHALHESIPEEITRLIDSHSGGFAIVALGHMANWHWAPDRYKEAFIGAFKRLPSNFLVLFSCAGGFPEERLPANVRIFKWLPQSALFQHPKIRLFFSHGGGNSVAEASIFGIPMVVMGLFAEQSDGGVRVQEHGLGIRLAKDDISADTMYNAINSVLTDPKYRENARKFAARMGNAPERAMERGIYWSEFVMRRRESLAKRNLYRRLVHSDSPVTELSWLAWIPYHNLDTIALGILILAFISYWTLRWFTRLYFWIQSFK